ncbi:MAG TPA: hypothetical protein ACFYEK_02050 [Candidatus Wunengus sp. YC60]|uniref:hypothetical protein n=1 Tax=Candidatus Wunengus sp. YC60 TaxID=3367697 RepID=UPI004027167F
MIDDIIKKTHKKWKYFEIDLSSNRVELLINRTTDKGRIITRYAEKKTGFPKVENTRLASKLLHLNISNPRCCTIP